MLSKKSGGFEALNMQSSGKEKYVSDKRDSGTSDQGVGVLFFWGGGFYFLFYFIKNKIY